MDDYPHEDSFHPGQEVEIVKFPYAGSPGFLYRQLPDLRAEDLTFEGSRELRQARFETIFESALNKVAYEVVLRELPPEEDWPFEVTW